jgi:uncharacterized protein YrzB (UPF0473 family)
MKNEAVYINENGEEIRVEVILSFSIEEFNKNYIAYTINDDDSLETAVVLINEVDIETNKLLPIKFEEKEMVLTTYNDIKKTIFGE